MRYLESENPYIIAHFTTGDTVTIDIYDLSDSSLLINGAEMTEIATTGYFKYLFNPTVSSLKEFLYIVDNSTEEHAGKIILGGYPDDIYDRIGVPDGVSISADINALNDITVADIIAGVTDGSYDLQKMVRLIFAACCNKSSGGGTSTLVFRNSSDNKDRIVETVDNDGNRLSVTLDGA